MSRTAQVASQVGIHLAHPDAVAGLHAHTDGGGLVLGRDRHRAPLVLRVFRPEPTRVVLIGGVGCAQLLAMRAVAIGANVVIETARPARWSSFVQNCGVPPEIMGYAPPGGRSPFLTTPTRPQLIVSDVGAALGQDITLTGGWRAMLVVRDELTAWDLDMLGSADLVVMQPLTEVEAALVASALGLTETQGWLSRIAPEMVAVAGRGGVRYALLSPTSLERRLLTSVTRAG
jgi:hypothetical protein